MLIRPAESGEIAAILDIFEQEVRAGRMLPRSPLEVRAHIEDWLVAEQDDALIGCVSLVFFDEALCELRSLAVVPDARGQGVGLALVEAILEVARQRGMQRVLTLTRAARLFEQVGFRVDEIQNYPQKVWRDCRPCPLRHRCDEIALIYHLQKERA